MKHELTVYKLGLLLKEIDLKYEIDILVKSKISGGFVTIVGKVEVESVPQLEGGLKGNNIITLKIKNTEDNALDLKITGIKDSKFNIEIEPTKYREIKISGLSINQVKESKEDCKIKIDDNIIFSVPAPYDNICDLFKS